MKFTQNTPVVSPNTIGNVSRKVAGDPMAYGTGGKDWAAMAGAVGQIAKVAQQEQDDMDAADLMEARNKIMGSLTESMYGEKGLLTNGIGENAKGLEGRVTDTVQKTFDSISKNYNIRVQRALRGNLNENMGNYQRIAAQQEGREYKKQKDSNYNISIQNGTNMSMTNYQDENMLDSNINDMMRIVDYRAKDMGWNESQRMQERRNVLTTLVGGTIQAAIDNGDLDTASIYNDRYGKYMNQTDVMKYQKVLRQETRLRDEKNEIDELTKMYVTPTGEPDWNRIEQAIKERAKETKTVGTSGNYFDDNGLNSEILAAAKEYDVDPALVAAVAAAESGGNQSTMSPAGAVGVMQLMPDTAAGLGVDPNNRKDNIRGGAKYLRQMLDRFGGDVRKAVAAYNAGPGAVDQYGGVPPYQETQNYVAKILDGTDSIYNKYKAKSSSGWDVDNGAGQYVGARMANGEKGCVEFVTKAGAAGGNTFLQDQLNRGVVYVPDLVANAGNKVIDFDASKLSKGDIIVYDDDEHVVIYDSGYKYYGNSSGQNQGVHGDDYRQMDGMRPTKIIKTGGTGGGGHTVNAHDSGYEDRMLRRMEAARSDWNRRKTDENNARLKGYEDQLRSTTDSGAIEFLERIKGSEPDSSIYSKAVSIARLYHPGAFRSSSSGARSTGAGSGGSRGGNTGKKYWMGKSGKQYTNAAKEEAERMCDVYNNDPNALKYAKQDDYDKAARIMNDIWASNYDDDVLAVVQGTFNENRGMPYDTITSLRDKYGMSEDQAADYINYYLRMNQNDTDDDE